MVKNTKGGSSHKKLARKKEDEFKVVKVDLNVNFKEMMIVVVDKNIGTCFTAKLVHSELETKEFNDKEIKVLHQRGRNAKKLYDRSQSRLALVSISDFKLASGCVGVVEEFIQMDHLNAYLKANKINQDTFDKLEQYLTITAKEIEEKQDDGIEFDRSNTNNNAQSEESSDSDEEINVDDI